MSTRTFTHKQRPYVDALASNPMQYQATLAGVEVRGKRYRTEGEAVASAWAALLAWSGSAPVADWDGAAEPEPTIGAFRADAEEAARLANAATPGWTDKAGYNNTGCPTRFFAIPGHNGGEEVEMMEQNSVFAVAARTGWPRDAARVVGLVAEVERLRSLADLCVEHERACFGSCGCRICIHLRAARKVAP